jgi:hypothetical protein
MNCAANKDQAIHVDWFIYQLTTDAVPRVKHIPIALCHLADCVSPRECVFLTIAPATDLGLGAYSLPQK